MSNQAGKITAMINALVPAHVNKAVAKQITEPVDEWLDEHITNPDSPPLDTSLSSSSAGGAPLAEPVPGRGGSSLYGPDRRLADQLGADVRTDRGRRRRLFRNPQPA